MPTTAPAAPCGHPGEVVIGTFVRCLHGCGGKTATPTPTARRGLPNHVEMCACKGCQVCRKVQFLHLVLKDGSKVGPFVWNGKDDIKYHPSIDMKIRHVVLLDKDGDQVGRKALWWDAKAGERLTIKVTPMDMGLTFSKDESYSLKRLSESVLRGVMFDTGRYTDVGYHPVIGRLPNETDDQLRERLKYKWAAEKWYDNPPSALRSIQLIALAVPGVKTVDVEERDGGIVKVRILRVTKECSNKAIVADVHHALRGKGPAGVLWQVDLCTPQLHMQRVVADVHIASRQWLLEGITMERARDRAQGMFLDAMKRHGHGKEITETCRVYYDATSFRPQLIFSFTDDGTRWSLMCSLGW